MSQQLASKADAQNRNSIFQRQLYRSYFIFLAPEIFVDAHWPAYDYQGIVRCQGRNFIRLPQFDDIQPCSFFFTIACNPARMLMGNVLKNEEFHSTILL